MSGPYGQPGYNPQYQNPYPAGGPPPAGWNASGQQQQGVFGFTVVYGSSFVIEGDKRLRSVWPILNIAHFVDHSAVAAYNSTTSFVSYD